MIEAIDLEHPFAPIGPEIERLNYAVQCKDVDFGTLDAPNQFNLKIINPLRDMIMSNLKKDRALRGGPGSKQRYTVSLVVTAMRDLDTVQ